MKTVFFRPTFVSAGTLALQLLALTWLFALTTSVAAVPQFGRPQLEMLDDAAPVPAGAPAAVVAAANKDDAYATTTSSSTVATPSVAVTNGASRPLGGVHAGLLVGAATAATSAFWFVL